MITLINEVGLKQSIESDDWQLMVDLIQSRITDLDNDIFGAPGIPWMSAMGYTMHVQALEDSKKRYQKILDRVINL